MKTILSALALTLAATTVAHADEPSPLNYEMETIVACHLAAHIIDYSQTVVVRHARIGAQMDAVLTQQFLGHRAVATVAELSHDSVDGIESFGGVANEGEFHLSINTAQTNEQGWSPAVLMLGEQRHELVCQHYMMAL